MPAAAAHQLPGQPGPDPVRGAGPRAEPAGLPPRRRYAVRSPNIISLLGDSSYLNRELDEASRHLELQYEYNPTMNRRNLGHSTELSARRSPLSDQDIASLLGQDGARETRVKIV